MKQAEVDEFPKALAYFDLEVVNLTGTAGYESRKGKTYAIKKNMKSFEFCVFMPPTISLALGQSDSF